MKENIKKILRVPITLLSLFLLIALLNRKLFSKKKVVLMALPWTTIGGAEGVMLQILSGLKRDGWDVYIFCTYKNQHEWIKKFREVSKSVMNLTYIPNKLKNHLLINFPRLVKTDVYFTQNSTNGYQVLEHIKRLHNLPTVDLVHCGEGKDDKGGMPMYSAGFDKYLDKRIVISNRLKKIYVDWYKINPKKISVVYNGIDPKEVRTAVNENLLDADEITFFQSSNVFIWVARYSEQKNPKDYVKLASLNKDKNFYMAGPGELFEELKKDSEQLSNFLIKGPISHEKFMTVLSKSKALILTSIYEGIPLAILEALALKVPVVSTNVGAINEVFKEGRDGFLTDPDNIVTDISNKLVLIKNLDKSKITLEKEFELDTMQKNYNKIFNELLSS